MTVSSTTSRVSYAGNGVTTAFPVPFYFLANADLKVFLRAPDGTETLQMETTHYTVSGAGNPAGGAVTFLVAPPSGTGVIILRDPLATQETDYIEAEKFPAETHERALDKLTMIAQRVIDRVSRALSLGETDIDGSGAYRANNNRITGLGGPIVGSDAAHKSYVDAAVSSFPQNPVFIDLAEIAAPANPPTNVLRIHVRDFAGLSKLVLRDSAGTEIVVEAVPQKTDETPFVIGTDQVSPTGFFVDDVSPDTVVEGNIGLARMSPKRVQYADLRDSVNERSAVIDPSGQLTAVAGGYTANPEVSFTRPADTTAYAAGDLVANSTTAGSVVSLQPAAARVAAGSFLVRRIRLRKSTTSLALAQFRVHFWATAPTPTVGDNGVFNAAELLASNNAANYLGSIDVTLARAMSDGAVGFAVPPIGNEIARKQASGTVLFALIEARAAYVPGNAEVFSLQLDVLQD